MDSLKREMAKTLSVGDRVVSDFHHGEGHLIRVILKIVKDRKFGSGYGVQVSRGIDENGDPRFGNGIKGDVSNFGAVDAAWVRPLSLVVAERLLED